MANTIEVSRITLILSTKTQNSLETPNLLLDLHKKISFYRTTKLATPSMDNFRKIFFARSFKIV